MCTSSGSVPASLLAMPTAAQSALPVPPTAYSKLAPGSQRTQVCLLNDFVEQVLYPPDSHSKQRLPAGNMGPLLERGDGYSLMNKAYTRYLYPLME